MINAVDCAEPHPGMYPPWASVVCGYVGGHTLHAWSLAEVNAVRQTGRKWWGIWTARNHEPGNPPLTAQDGITDAAGMLARLPALNYTDKLQPLFYDIEPGIFDLDPIGARAAITAFKTGISKAGWLHVYSYTVKRQGGDWIADPTGVKPTSIPPGVIGVQYGGDVSFDYDVFSDSLLVPPVPKGPKMFGYLIEEPPTSVRPFSNYWAVALDLTARVQINAISYTRLQATGNYGTNPGLDEGALLAIPDVTSR